MVRARRYVVERWEGLEATDVCTVLCTGYAFRMSKCPTILPARSILLIKEDVVNVVATRFPGPIIDHARSAHSPVSFTPVAAMGQSDPKSEIRG